MNWNTADQPKNTYPVTIFANGEISSDQISLPLDGIIIAADGGARHCLKLGIMPNIVIGDFDSLSVEEFSTLESGGTEFIHHPAEKDETDLELALDYALGLNVSEISLYGLLGGRWDMTFSNVLLLASPRYDRIKLQLKVGQNTAYILHGGQSLKLKGQPGDRVSAISLNGTASGISYDGLEWPLVNADLPFGSPRGVSNTMAVGEAHISLEEGTLLVFFIESQTK